jgi:hypothetical protein
LISMADSGIFSGPAVFGLLSGGFVEVSTVRFLPTPEANVGPVLFPQTGPEGPNPPLVGLAAPQADPVEVFCVIGGTFFVPPHVLSPDPPPPKAGLSPNPPLALQAGWFAEPNPAGWFLGGWFGVNPLGGSSIFSLTGAGSGEGDLSLATALVRLFRREPPHDSQSEDLRTRAGVGF